MDLKRMLIRYEEMKKDARERGIKVDSITLLVLADVIDDAGLEILDKLEDIDTRLFSIISQSWDEMKVEVTPSLARAIIEMDNIAFSEGLGPEEDCSEAWKELLASAEQLTGIESIYTHCLRHQNEIQAAETYQGPVCEDP